MSSVVANSELLTFSKDTKNCSPQPGLKEIFADEFQGTAPDGTRYGKARAMATDLTNFDRQC
jgi:hypothetical protein